MSRPIYELPVGWNPNEAEGRAAFLAGEEIDSHRYGESSAAKEFEAGWRAEQARAGR